MAIALCPHAIARSTSFVALETPAGYALPGAFGLQEALDVAREVADEAPLTDAIVRHAAPEVVNDAEADDDLARRGWAQFWGFRSYAGVPVRDVHGHVVGALSIMSREPRDFDNTTVTRLTELAAVCSARVVAR